MLRIKIDGGDTANSPYITILNDRGDAVPPTLSGITATAVENSSNDILVITYDEPVLLSEAESLSNYALENPPGEGLTIPNGSTISYNVVNGSVTIVLDGDDTANLRFGTESRIAVSGVHDLIGNEIVTNPGGTASVVVDGDGSSLPEDRPDLEAVIYFGSGNPKAGELLFLIFNEEMDVDTDNVFDAADVAFWNGGDTIGTSSPISASVVPANPDVIRVVLGTAPSFTPGSSRINISHNNDVVADLAGNAAYFPPVPTYYDYVEIVAMESEAPVIDHLTLNDIPRILNGTGPAGGSMQAPRTGFDIDLYYHDEGGAGVDPETIEISSSVSVTAGEETLTPGTDLVPYLTEIRADGDGATYNVPTEMQFSQGTVILTASVDDILGNGSDPVSYTFTAGTPSVYQRPFETTANPSQVWRLIFGRDIYTIQMSGSAYIIVDADMTPNGEADFDEDLRLFGLNCQNPIPVPGTGSDSNEVIDGTVIAAVESELALIFDGANIEFTHADTAAFPGNAPQVAYGSHEESLISIGGDSDLGALGVAFIDRCNNNQDNDVLYKGSSPYNPGTNLGVMTTRIFIYEVNRSSMGLFRQTFDHFIPGRGIPVGTGVDDEAILMEIAGTGPPVSGDAAVRRDRILSAVDRLARYIAVVGAHEMGHSLGLSADGAMPYGLYGGDAVNFPGSTSYHIDLTTFLDLFIIPNVNIMTPSTNFDYTNASGTRFNRLNKAYLKESIYCTY